MATVHDVAAYILKKCGPMSSMKLQKLVYYSQAWNLVWVEEPIFGEPIQAWANGPVVYDLFRAHRGLFTVDEEWAKGDADALTATERGTVDAVVDNYGNLTGRQLSALTHDEGPWREARQGLAPTDRSTRTIDLESLAEYYGALDLSEDATPVSEVDWGAWPTDPR